MDSENLEEINREKENITRLLSEFSAKFAQTGHSSGASSSTSNNQNTESGERVVDADYTVVDEDNKN
jgi:hypothetical protein